MEIPPFKYTYPGHNLLCTSVTPISGKEYDPDLVKVNKKAIHQNVTPVLNDDICLQNREERQLLQLTAISNLIVFRYGFSITKEGDGRHFRWCLSLRFQRFQILLMKDKLLARSRL